MSRNHTASLPSGLVITFRPVTVRRMIALQGMGRTMAEMSPWIADVCDLPIDTILDLEGSDWHALARAILSTMTPSKEDAAPLGDGQARPEKVAP